MEILARYPPTPTQLGMLLDHVRGAQPGVDIEQLVVHGGADIDPTLARRAWERVTERHEALRSRFDLGDGDPVVVAMAVAPTAFDLQVLTDADAAGWPHVLAAFLKADRARGFDLTQPSAHRVKWFVRPGGHHTMVWTVHHAWVDGRSIFRVLREWSDALQAFSEGRDPGFTDAPSPGVHATAVAASDHRASLPFWRTILAGCDEPTPAPFARPAGPGPAPHRGVSLSVEEAQAAHLRRFASGLGVTMNTLVQGAWGLVLARTANATDVIFGATRACRRGPTGGEDTAVGCFINTVPMRASARPERSVASYLRELRGRWVDMRPWENTPMAVIHEAADFRSEDALFETFVVFEGQRLPRALARLGGPWATRQVEQHEHAGLPLGLAAYDDGDLHLELEYDTGRFPSEDMARLLEHVRRVLLGLAEDADRRLDEVPWLSDEELETQRARWNDTKVAFPEGETLVSLIDGARARFPERVAVRAREGALTYAAFVAQAERVAAGLVARGVGRGDAVGLCLERSFGFAATLLGVMRVGAAFVPLDGTYPRERLLHMVRDAGVRLVVVDGRARAVRDAVAGDGVACVTVDMLTEVGDAPRPEAAPLPTDVAYVIYTSGSTGLPKGVPITHRALVNHAFACRRVYGLSEGDIVPQFASISFDIAIEEMFPTWAAGGTVTMRPEHVADTRRFNDWLEREGVTVLQLPTAFFHEWGAPSMVAGRVRLPPRVRLVVIGGERASRPVYDAWRAWVGPGVRWMNTYGPTETTVTATCYEAGPGLDAGDIPIGRPLPNTRVHVLGWGRREVPVGIVGELYIAGDGVSPGYLRRPELTKKRFVTLDVGDRAERAYRTGIVRWLPSGDLMFVGRVDEQVKVQGFRIELAEVERALASSTGVEQVAVVTHAEGHGPAVLVGYYVPAKVDPVSGAALREELLTKLPPFMVPPHLVPLPHLPKLPNGKVDRRALSKLKPTVSTAEPASTPPRNVVEMMLADVWKDVLGRSEVDIHDDFFAIGGNSLQSIRLLDRANKLGLRVNLEGFFQNPTIAGLAATTELRQEVDGDCVVALQPLGARPPLFLFHSVPGDLLGYGNLVYHLGKNQPCFGFQARGLVDEGRVHRTIEGMAEHYASRLRALAPEGPYVLVGWCFGGQVALAAAKALERAGRTVDRLVLIEAFPREPYGARMKAQLGTLAKRGPVAWGRFLGARLTQFGRAEPDPDAVFALNAREGIFKNRVLVHDVNTKALIDHVDPPYGGEVLLVRVEEPPHRVREHDYGWSRLAPRVEVAVVPGDHETLLKEPHVRAVATVIAGRLATVPGWADG